MDCIKVSQNLYDYLDGEIGPFRRQAVSRHLESCVACSAGFDFEVRVRQTLWQKCRDPLPAEVRTRVLGALAEAGASGTEAPDLGVPGLSGDEG